MVWVRDDRDHELEEECRGEGLVGSQNPQDWVSEPMTASPVTVNLAVPGLPQMSRPILVNKKGAFED